MRDWSVSAHFPEVRPAHLAAYQSCVVKASDIKVAAGRGLAEILSRQEMKGKHISVVKLSIVVASKEKGAHADSEEAKAAAA